MRGDQVEVTASRDLLTPPAQPEIGLRCDTRRQHVGIAAWPHSDIVACELWQRPSGIRQVQGVIMAMDARKHGEKLFED